MPVSLRGPSWHVSAASTAQRDLGNCQTRLLHTQGSVGLQFPSLASRSVGKCQDSRLREKLPGPLPGHTCLAHTEPPRPPRLARQTLMRACSALDPPHILTGTLVCVAVGAVVLGRFRRSLRGAFLALRRPDRSDPGPLPRFLSARPALQVETFQPSPKKTGEGTGVPLLNLLESCRGPIYYHRPAPEMNGFTEKAREHAHYVATPCAAKGATSSHLRTRTYSLLNARLRVSLVRREELRPPL